MPIVHVHLQEGRSVAQKRRLAAEVTQALVRALEVKPEAVRILIHELDPEHYSIAGVTLGEVPLQDRNRNAAGVEG